MNVGIMYDVVSRLVESSKEYQIQKAFSDLTAFLNRYGFSSEKIERVAFVEAIKKFRELLGIDVFNEYSSIDNLVIDELGLRRMLGRHIVDRLNFAIEGFDVNPKEVIVKINEIKDDYNKIIDKLEKLSASLLSLSVERHVVAPGDVEVNVVYPEDVSSFCLCGVEKEFRDINRIMILLAEVVGDDLNSVSVASVGSSRLTVVVKSSVKVATCLSIILTFILNSYSTYLDIKKKTKELSDMGISEENVERIRKEAEDKYLKNFGDIIEGVIKKHLQERDMLDEGRKNELVASAKDVLNKISDKIMDGVEIDVSAQEFVSEDDSSAVGHVLYNRQISELRASMKNLKQLRQKDQLVKRLESQGGHNCQS